MIALDCVKQQRKEAKSVCDYNPTVSAVVDVLSDIKDIFEKVATAAPVKTRKLKPGALIGRLVYQHVWPCAVIA